MPRQVTDQQKFKDLLPFATEVRMKRSKANKVKLKIRTSSYLYTYNAEPKEADLLWRDVKVLKTEIK